MRVLALQAADKSFDLAHGFFVVMADKIGKMKQLLIGAAQLVARLFLQTLLKGLLPSDILNDADYFNAAAFFITNYFSLYSDPAKRLCAGLDPGLIG